MIYLAGRVRMELEDLVGRTIDKINVHLDSAYDDVVKIIFKDKTAAVIELYGECCSWSRFDPFDWNTLLERQIQSITEREVGSEETPDSFTQCSEIIIGTDEGDIVIPWRNISNGYYCGWVHVYAIHPEQVI